MQQLESFHVIAFTHKQFPVDEIGKIHIRENAVENVLPLLKSELDCNELMFLETCNRVELYIRSSSRPDANALARCLQLVNPALTVEESEKIANAAFIVSGLQAVEYVFKVVSSLESMVVGEREIITQFRKAYDQCAALGLTGDFLRLMVTAAIQTGKDIYTNTEIARNPVSVASLAYRKLRELGLKNNSRIVFIGSGETNSTLASYFSKHQFANFTVFNRTLGNGQKLAATLNASAHALADIGNFKGGFDVLVVCTASTEPVVTQEMYQSLLAGEQSRKVIIDLGNPANVESSVAAQQQVCYIDIASLKSLAEANMERRKGEFEKCNVIISSRVDAFLSIYEERKVEVAFGSVPRQVRAIRELAVNEVFADEIGSLDENGKEVLEKVLAYMEKKYNAVAIKTAKEVLLPSRANMLSQE